MTETDRFRPATDFFRGATTPEEKRIAAHLWLGAAIRWALEEGKDASPALALLGALEGLDFGRVDPMLRLPAGQKKGGKEASPAETGLKAIALAAVDRRVECGEAVSSSIALVADELRMEPGALENLRKKVSRERAKPPAKRSQYRSLIEDYEKEKEQFEGKTKDEVMWTLVCLSMAMGWHSE